MRIYNYTQRHNMSRGGVIINAKRTVFVQLIWHMSKLVILRW